MATNEPEERIDIRKLYNYEVLDQALRPKLKKLIQEDVVTRREWSAKYPSGVGSIGPLTFPLDQVIITYTESNPCGDRLECGMALRGVQELFMRMGYHDIPYNFIITTEGDIFEGRAWLDECPIPNSLGDQSKTLVIGIIGDKSDCYGKAEEAVSTQINKIIDHGLKHEIIAPRFLKRDLPSWHFRYKHSKEYMIKNFPEIKPYLPTD